MSGIESTGVSRGRASSSVALFRVATTMKRRCAATGDTEAFRSLSSVL
jgi:hypothetical protein